MTERRCSECGGLEVAEGSEWHRADCPNVDRVTEFMMVGYPARLTIDLPDGPHDVTHCIEWVQGVTSLAGPSRLGCFIDATRLMSEIEIEKRARARAATRITEENR